MDTMAVKQVKESEIIKIAFLVTVLVNLPRTISFFEIANLINEYFVSVSFADLILRLSFFFGFSWVVLQFNSNWKYQFSKYSTLLKTSIEVVGNLAILLITINLMKYVYPYLVGELISQWEIKFLYFIFTIILIVLFFIARILRFQIIQRESIIENERLKQQNLQKELTALKNQINPHFLFNSLNSLNSLIRDNKEATNFVKKLSFMYRYILQSGDRDLVSLKEELKFLESYAHLIKVRYRDRFKTEIQIENQYLDRDIPPLALQLLVENAIKHNEISETNPLKVKIYSKDEAIYIENQMRPRSTFAVGTGNGLLNLDKRYFLLRKQQIVINKENNVFRVKLPLNKTS